MLEPILLAVALVALQGSASPEEPAEPVAPRGPVPHAGADLELRLGAVADLRGRIEGLSPLDFWVADGNEEFENMLVRCTDGALTAVGPMRHTNGQVMGWTGDLVRVGERVYGIDVGQRYVFYADLEGGICLPVTPQLPGSWRGLQSLAYDAEGNRLFSIDQASATLVEIERGTGEVRRLPSAALAGRQGLRSLAYEPTLDLLFTIDSDADLLLAIDPDTGALSDSMGVPELPNSQVEELTFYEGELYAMVGLLDDEGALLRGQLEHIDIRTGYVTPLGPPIDRVSPHALLVNSVPETYYWTQVAGPAVAELEYTTLLETRARFPGPGRYEFALTVLTPDGPASDRVAVDVLPPADE